MNKHPVRLSQKMMLRAPLFPTAVGVTLGVMLDRAFCPSMFFTGVVFVLASVSGLVGPWRRRAGWLTVTVASIALGSTLHFATQRRVPPSSVERWIGAERTLARVRGVVHGRPRQIPAPEWTFSQWTFGTDTTVFLLDVDTFVGTNGTEPISGRVRVKVAEAVLDLRDGETVEAFGWLSALHRPRTPGVMDWASLYRRRGIAGTLLCRHRENVQRRGPPPERVDSWVTRMRAKANRLLTNDLASGDGAGGSLLAAMVLGQRSKVDRLINETFIRAGCAHFLAVSGVHVVIVMVLVGVFCAVFRIRRRGSTWLVMVAVIFYATVAEPRPPILRASIVAVLYCIARLLGRERARLNWIAAASLLITVVSPGMVFDVGYQLSFAAVLGVAFLVPALHAVGRSIWPGLRRETLSGDRRTDSASGSARPRILWSWWAWRTGWMRRYVTMGFFVALAAWLATLPIAALYFNRVQPWSTLASLIVFPLVSLVMGFSVVKLVVTAALPALSGYAGVILGSLNALLIRVVDLLASLPHASVVCRSPGFLWMAAYYLLLLGMVWYVRSRRAADLFHRAGDDDATLDEPKQRLSGMVLVAMVGGLVLLVSMGITDRTRPEALRRDLRVTALSVGAGLATVIELPDGKTVLFDAGNLSPYDVGRTTIVPFLRHRGVGFVDRIYVSHPNLDHFSGVPAIVENVGVGSVVVNEYFRRLAGPRSPSQRLLTWLASHDHAVNDGRSSPDRWTYGGVVWERLWPLQGAPEPPSANDSSTVLRLRYAGRSMLLTGDNEEHALRAMLKRGDLRADVLFLPHHGGAAKSTDALVAAVAPRIVVRSGSGSLMQRRPGIADVLGDRPLFDTGEVGAVTIHLDTDGVRVTSFLDADSPR